MPKSKKIKDLKTYKNTIRKDFGVRLLSNKEFTMSEQVQQPKSIAGYKIDNGIVNVTGNQMTAFHNGHSVLSEHGIEITFDDYVNTQLSKSMGSAYLGKWENGTGSTSADSPRMAELKQQIKTIILASAEVVINGKPMFVDQNGIPKEYSGTFTVRTPVGYERKDYLEELKIALQATLDQVEDLEEEILEVENDNPINQ